MIATPSHNCWVHIDHKKACLALQAGAIKAGIEIDFIDIGNQVTKKARNSMISYFHENKKYTHYVHLDADVGIPNNCIPKLLSREVDVIGVPVPLAGYLGGRPVLNIGDILTVDETGLAEVEHIGNAVLMFSRKAVGAIIADSEPYKDDPRYTKGQPLTPNCYDVFYVGVLDGIYRPEDYSTCYRLRKLGFRIYADLTIPVVHNKMHGYSTTEDFLAELRDQSNYGISWGGMSISKEDWAFIHSVIKEVKPPKVLEFGAGLSSLLMSELVPVISYETDPVHAQKIMKKASGSNDLQIMVWDGRLMSFGKYQLAFVDGPMGKLIGGPGRHESIFAASQCARHVIVHDCNRSDERKWQQEYLAPSFNLISKSGRGKSACAYWRRKDVGSS